MRYMLLIHSDPSSWESLSQDEINAAREAVMPEWNTLFEELGASGQLRDGNELDDPKTARTVRVRGGERIVTDGPFAETKEQLGGYFLVECDNLDQAIAWAAKIPSAKRGTVEVRPIIDH